MAKDMRFREWLVLEVGNKVQVDVDPSVQPIPVLFAGSTPKQMASPEELKQIAVQGLRKYFTKIDPRGFRYLKDRYRFKITKATDDSDGLKLTISIIPIEKNPGSEEYISPDHPAYDYYQKYKQGKTGKKVYKTPRDAIEEIPADPSLAYRGISWEEWQHIRKTGYIASRGMYNLGQEGYTLFGKEPATAVHYANGFAPLQYQTSFRKPSVVIAIPRGMTLTNKDDPDNIPDTELGVKGKLGKEHIVSVWMLSPTKTNQDAFIELIFQYVPAWDEKKYKDPMTGFFKLDPNQVRAGSGVLYGINSFAIRKLL